MQLAPEAEMTLFVPLKMELSEGWKAFLFSRSSFMKPQDEKEDFSSSQMMQARSQVKTNPRFSVCLEATGISSQVLNKRAFVCTHDGSLWSPGILIGNFSYLPILEEGRLGNREGKDQEKGAALGWLQAHWVNMLAPL